MALGEFDSRECLLRVRQHDQEAARALVEALHPLVIRLVRSHLPLGSAEEALKYAFAVSRDLKQLHGTPISTDVDKGPRSGRIAIGRVPLGGGGLDCSTTLLGRSRPKVASVKSRQLTLSPCWSRFGRGRAKWQELSRPYLRVFSQEPNGHEVTLNILKTGDALGDLALFHYMKRLASIEVTSDCVLLLALTKAS